ncbi:hypothetical protein F5Y06DRAFT_113220 [Hypoxylon sp. FL0890]|nr:hypothetical protein F5Y06DRAFT_113220 [Hypoxylon sp. FL0890]
MSSDGTQPQFDIVGAATTSTSVASHLVRNFGRIFPQCLEEGVVPLVVPPLERLGSWLMVDADRLRDGEATFLNMPAPKSLSWRSLSIIIGLSNNPKESLVKIVSRDQCLIAAFLCLCGCTMCFDTRMASNLMHELMRLNGTLKDYAIPVYMVHQFAEAMNGCNEFTVGERPSDVYCKLAEAVNRATRYNAPGLENLYNVGDTNRLAKIIYETFDKMQNQDFQFIYLRGTLQGLWLASFFVWLRPREVQVQVSNSIIYPYPDPLTTGGNGHRRLLILLEKSGPGVVSNNIWQVTPWSVAETIPIQISLKEDTKDWLEKQHPSPLLATRCQLSHRYSTQAVVNIGNVAAALVVIATENGQVWNQGHAITQRLQDVCSESFLSSYAGVFTEFGFTIDPARRANIVGIITDIMTNQNALSNLIGSYTDDIEFLKGVMVASSRDYATRFGEPMLSGLGDAEEEAVFEHAIHLAGEGILFAFCDNRSKSLLYQPLEPFRLSQNAKLLRSLLQPEVGYDFWAIRKRVIETLLPGASMIQSGDLAVAGNGYVVCSYALASWDEQPTTDRRRVASLCIFPGPLKAKNVEGKISRLTEDKENRALSSRLLNVHVDSILLHRDGSCGLDEHDAVNKAQTEIAHSWRFESDVQTIHMTTFIKVQVGTNESLISLANTRGCMVPTSWERSIDAITFATHVASPDFTTQQLKSLVELWTARNYLGDNLRWCSIGMAIRGNVRYITTTSQDEQVRFLEAGNLVAENKLLIRTRGTPLLSCIAVAIEAYQDEKWVIIA